jgi:hypothetical protein
MDLNTLTDFFMWCTIINGAILTLWIVSTMVAPDLVHRTQRKWFPLPREKFDVVIYAFLGFYKVVFLIFNVAPYAALLIIA